MIIINFVLICKENTSFSFFKHIVNKEDGGTSHRLYGEGVQKDKIYVKYF